MRYSVNAECNFTFFLHNLYDYGKVNKFKLCLLKQNKLTLFIKMKHKEQKEFKKWVEIVPYKP